MGVAAEQVCFVGGGRMAEAIISGVIGHGVPADRIDVVEPLAQRREHLQERFGIGVHDDLAPVGRATLVVLAVKPQQMGDVLEPLSAAIAPGTLVVSIAAGVPTAAFEAALPGAVVVRVMPNTPALVGEAMSVLSPGSTAGPQHLERVEALLSAVGRVATVPEGLQDAVTAVSGSGPAYVFYLVEAMVAAGTELGLARDLAYELAVQTVLGAATMLSTTQEDPAVLRANVTSPGGTTAAAIATLDQREVRAAFEAALTAARDRSVELAG